MNATDQNKRRAIMERETYRWDTSFPGGCTRLGIRNRCDDSADYVVAIEEGDAVAIVRVCEADGSAGFDDDVRHRAYRLLADVDPNEARRSYWTTRLRCSRSIALPAFYDQMQEMNIAFGEPFRAVREIWRGEHEAIGLVDLSESLRPEASRYIHHPVFLDACLQLFGATLFDEPSRKTFLPIGMESFTIEPGPIATAWSHVTLCKPVEIEDTMAQANCVFYDLGLRKIGEIAGFTLQLSDRTQMLDNAAALTGPRGYRIGWEPSPLDRALDAENGKLAVTVLGEGSLAEALRRGVSSRGTGIDVLDSAAAVVAVDVDELAGSQAASDLFLQTAACLGLDRPESPLQRLWFVTRSAQQVTGHDAVAPLGALAWGFARSIEREYPNIRVCCIDVGQDSDASDVLRELSSSSSETMVAYRAGTRSVQRIVPLEQRSGDAALAPEPFILRTSGYGSFENLYLAPLEPAIPGDHDVQIDVRATGLNFKDVLHALGMLVVDGVQSGVARAEEMLFGGDCGGIVTRVGSQVTRLKPGDRVVATMAYGAFASSVIVREDFVSVLPETIDFDVAAAVPTAYLTAYHALITCARIKPGERVFIHAAAGGVGLAATQLALSLGATVYATAGRTKHAYLRAMGVARVFDSRTLEFADHLGSDETVDIVVNSLSRAFMDRSLSVLKLGGRFVEIGKLEAYSPQEMAEARPDVGYTLFDLMDVARDEPTVIARTFETLLDLLATGSISAPRLTRFPMGRAQDAFRHMAEARHIGKIVLTRSDHPIASLDPDHVQVVVGGSGAIGRRVVRWLGARGARNIAIVGRSAPDDRALADISALRASGVAVTVLRADVSNAAGAAELFEALATHGRQLGSIFHLAGVLSDGLLRNQTSDGFARVLRAKCDSAMNLDRESRRVRHDGFICFSSIASVFGSAGQANYAAANAIVDAIVQQRRSLGLPGTVVNWGPWSDGGMASALDETAKARLIELGITPLDPDDALALLERILVSDEAQTIVAEIDWSRATAFPGARIPPSVATLSRSGGSGDDASESIDTLRTLPSSDRFEAMLGAVIHGVARVLRLAVDDIAAHNTLASLGLDSLMAMELRHSLERLTGAPVPVSVLMKSPTLAELSEELMRIAGFDAGSRDVVEVASHSGDLVSTSRALVRVGGAAPALPLLICFHHLGGSAEFFQRWAEPLAGGAEIIAVQLPGRGQRADEPAALDFGAVFEEIIAVLTPHLARPFVIYGHSMGSHFAFEFARTMLERGRAASHLFVSGLWSPGDHNREKLAERLVINGETYLELSPALRADQEYMRALAAVVRNDAALHQSYAGYNGTALGIPVTAFSGESDPVAPPDTVARWSATTSAAFGHRTLPGRHMFIVENAGAIHAAIRSSLRACSANPPSRELEPVG